MANEIHHGEMYRPGMALLAYRFGVMNAEMFIAAVKTGNSDYTKWKRQAFDGITTEEFDAAVAGFAASHVRFEERVPH